MVRRRTFQPTLVCVQKTFPFCFPVELEAHPKGGLFIGLKVPIMIAADNSLEYFFVLFLVRENKT